MKKPSENLTKTDRPIVTLPDKRLHQQTKKVSDFDIALLDQIVQMQNALKKEGGVGLAANQLGYNNRILIAECPYEDRGIIPMTVFVNPEIVEYSVEKDIADEGCLSIPPIELETERSIKLKVKYQDEKGLWHKIAPKGFLARILQHEVDHLNGILFTDRVKEKFFHDFPTIYKQKIIFIGSGEFAEIVLKGLLALNLPVKLIITESAKPAGRNRQLRPTKVSELAKLFQKSLIETQDIKQDIDRIKEVNPDLIILTDFGQILPSEILSIPKLGALNLHPSLLPKYRGSTPIQTAILNGDKETGVSLIQMVPEIDKGPVFAQIKTEIYFDDNSLTLEKRLAVMAVKLLFHALPRFTSDELKPMPQSEAKASKTQKLKKEDGEINWGKSNEEIDRQIRAYFPWPGAYTRLPAPKRSNGRQAFLGGKRLIIHQSHIDDAKKLILDVVQLEGKSPMSFSDFIKGYQGPKPDWFGKIHNEIS